MGWRARLTAHATAASNSVCMCRSQVLSTTKLRYARAARFPRMSMMPARARAKVVRGHRIEHTKSTRHRDESESELRTVNEDVDA